MSQQFDEDAAYAAAHAEALGSNRQPGLWARVFSQSGGDENKAVASYISKRFEQLRQASSEAEEAAQKLESENKASIAKVQQKVEHVSVEKNEKHDTEVVSTFDIERRLREEFGVKTHTRRKDQEWILRNQHGLIGTFHGEAAFKEAAKAIFMGESPKNRTYDSFEKNPSESTPVGHENIFSEGRFFDPSAGLAKNFWLKYFLPNFLLIFFSNLILDISGGFGLFLILFWIFALSYSTIAIICVWKSANTYKGPKWIAVLTKTYIVLAIILGIMISIGKNAQNNLDKYGSIDGSDQSIQDFKTQWQDGKQPSEEIKTSDSITARGNTPPVQKGLLEPIPRAEEGTQTNKQIKPTYQQYERPEVPDIELAETAERNENLTTCLSGQFPNLCKRSMLTAEQKIAATAAERRENLSICLTGYYPSLCKHSWLSNTQKAQAKMAEWERNREICLSGAYSMLCNKNLLRNKPTIPVS